MKVSRKLVNLLQNVVIRLFAVTTRGLSWTDVAGLSQKSTIASLQVGRGAMKENLG